MTLALADDAPPPAPETYATFAYAHTNVLALPPAHIVIEASNNEDWVDSLVYTVAAGAAGPGSPPPPQMDLRGIQFEMMLRRRPQDHEVILGSATLAGSLSVGAAPNYGHLIFYFSHTVMRRLWPGRYVGDVIARDRRFERVALTIDLTVIHGITR